MRFLGNTAELFRFCVAGGVGFVVDYGLLYTATEFLGIRYLYSSAISFTVTVVVNYCLCLCYVFKPYQKQSKKQITAFFLVSIFGLLLNQLCMWFLVERVAIYYMAAKIVATILVIAWNYVMKKMTIRGMGV